MFPILTEDVSGARVLSAEIERTVPADQSHESWFAATLHPKWVGKRTLDLIGIPSKALGTGIAEPVPLQ
jgi:hypothetical protein